MQTVPQFDAELTQTGATWVAGMRQGGCQVRPAPKAFFAHLADTGASGVLLKPAEDVLFFDTSTRQYTTITAANEAQVIVLAEVSIYMAQYYADQAAARQERAQLRQTTTLEVA